MLWITPTLAQGPLLTPEGERIRLDELAELVDEAEAIGRAAAFAHHHVPIGPGTSPACTPEGASAAARALVLTTAWGEATARARLRADVLAGLRDAPTLAPLRTPERAARLEALLDRANRTEAAHKGANTAIQRRITPYSRRCPAPVARAKGWKHPGLVASDDPDRLIAAWVASEGWLCGAKRPVQVAAGPVILDVDQVCWSADPACACETASVDAGAVLGGT